MTQFTSEVKNMATASTMSNATGIEEMPAHAVSRRKAMSATKAETMNTSPWAKFTIPMMPNTIV